MPINEKELEEALLSDPALQDIMKRAMEDWLEVSEKHGHEYQVTKEGEQAIPVDDYNAKLDHFGSATLQKAPTYWFDRAREEWEKIKHDE